MSKESKSGSTVHLALEQLRFRVDACARPVAVGQGEAGDRGIVVLVQSAKERFEFGHTASRGFA